jgi:hypothetical protein
MDGAQLRTRTRALDWELQALAAVYEELWETLQEELDDGADLDPDGAIGRRLMGLATGLPHLGRVFGPQDPPARAVFVVTSNSGGDSRVDAVFLSESRACRWVARQPSPDLFEVQPHALEHPHMTPELRTEQRHRGGEGVDGA